jgi:hypothetical protein
VQSTLQLPVQVMSQTAPPRHWTLLEEPTVTWQLLSSSQLTFELFWAVMSQVLPAAQSVSHEAPQVTSQELPMPQSKLHESRHVSLVQAAPAWHAQLVPVQAHAGPGHDVAEPEQPASRVRVSDAAKNEDWVMLRSLTDQDRARERSSRPTACIQCAFSCAPRSERATC